MTQPSIMDMRMAELRAILKPSETSKYNIKNFLKQNGIDPAYMNFYKFIKDDEFPLPLLGLMNLVEANGFELQICVTRKDSPINDSQEWDLFLKSMEVSVKANTAIKEAKVKKTRKSSNEIAKSMGEGSTTVSEIEISNLFSEIW